MKPFDIHHAKFIWRGCPDPRPWLLVRRDGIFWLCFAISGQDYDSTPFEVRNDDPDFPATGLTKTSYIYDSDSFSRLPPQAFMHRHGALSGQLLRRFRDSSGL